MCHVLIIGDGGHGEKTPGKRTPLIPGKRVIHEHEFNQPTCAKFLKKALEIGFYTCDVAPENYDVSLNTRTDRANSKAKDFKRQYPDGIVLFVSFHFNAYNGVFDGKGGGVEVHYYPGANDGKELAVQVQKQLIKGTPQYNRGIKASDFHVLRETSMTAILIEAGFMDKLNEAKLMLDEKFQEEVATETLQGVINYLKEQGLKVLDHKKETSLVKLQKENDKLKSENICLKRELQKHIDEKVKVQNALKIIKNYIGE